MSSNLSHGLIVTAAVVLLGAAVPVTPASAAADFTKFHQSCLSDKSAAFLLGGDVSKEQSTAVLAVLCPCLEEGFSTMNQPEVDALEADLRTGNSNEAKSKYKNYDSLQQAATSILGICYSSEPVSKILTPQPSSAPKN